MTIHHPSGYPKRVYDAAGTLVEIILDVATYTAITDLLAALTDPHDIDVDDAIDGTNIDAKSSMANAIHKNSESAL